MAACDDYKTVKLRAGEDQVKPTFLRPHPFKSGLKESHHLPTVSLSLLSVFMDSGDLGNPQASPISINERWWPLSAIRTFEPTSLHYPDSYWDQDRGHRCAQ
jgi:hypothetical protein